MDYLVRFVGHIIESQRPIDFPQKIYQDLVVRVDNDLQLKNATNDTASLIIKQGGMVVPKITTEEIDESMVKYDSKIFVPMNMISYVETETKQMSSPMPDTEEGIKLQ